MLSKSQRRRQRIQLEYVIDIALEECKCTKTPCKHEEAKKTLRKYPAALEHGERVKIFGGR